MRQRGIRQAKDCHGPVSSPPTYMWYTSKRILSFKLNMLLEWSLIKYFKRWHMLTYHNSSLIFFWYLTCSLWGTRICQSIFSQKHLKEFTLAQQSAAHQGLLFVKDHENHESITLTWVFNTKNRFYQSIIAIQSVNNQEIYKSVKTFMLIGEICLSLYGFSPQLDSNNMCKCCVSYSRHIAYAFHYHANLLLWKKRTALCH